MRENWRLEDYLKEIGVLKIKFWKLNSKEIGFWKLNLKEIRILEIKFERNEILEIKLKNLNFGN